MSERTLTDAEKVWALELQRVLLACPPRLALYANGHTELWVTTRPPGDDLSEMDDSYDPAVTMLAQVLTSCPIRWVVW